MVAVLNRLSFLQSQDYPDLLNMRSIGIALVFICFWIKGAAQVDAPPHYDIVGSWQDNNYTVIYPLGWSKTGDFAYIFQDVNGMGGAWIYTFDLIIQKSGTNEPVYLKEYVYDLEQDDAYTKYADYTDSLFDPDDSTYYVTAWLKNVLWPEHHLEIDKVLKSYAINRTTSAEVKALVELEKEGFQLIIQKETDTVNAWRVDSKLELCYVKNKGEKVRFYELMNIVNEDGLVVMENGYDLDLLFYTIEGFIKSPIKNEYFFYIHKNTLGYEELSEELMLISLILPD